MKRLTSILIALLILAFSLIGAAAVDTGVYADDYEGYIYYYGDTRIFTAEERTELEIQISQFVDTHEMDLFFVIKSGDPSADAQAYADRFKAENYYDINTFIMVNDLDNNAFEIYTEGFCNDIFTDDVKTQIFNALDIYYDAATGEYNNPEMYENIIKDVEYYYNSKRPIGEGAYAPNYDFDAPDSGGAFVIDDCDLFTDEQETALLTKIEAFRSKYSCDLVLHTTNSLGGKFVSDYADDYYDYNDYADDGLLFMVCMAGGEGNRDYYTSTKGYAITALTDYARTEVVEKSVLPLLSSGDYYEAFDEYIDMASLCFDAAKDGEPYDYSNPYMLPGDYFVAEIMAALVAAVIAFVVVGAMKKKMNTAIKKTDARDYVIAGSMNITGSQDVFSHSTVSKTAIPKSTSSGGGGSSTHSSSSGSSHGGGGGKF